MSSIELKSAQKEYHVDVEQTIAMLKALGITDVGVVSLNVDLKLGHIKLWAEIVDRPDVLENWRKAGWYIEGDD